MSYAEKRVKQEFKKIGVVLPPEFDTKKYLKSTYKGGLEHILNDEKSAGDIYRKLAKIARDLNMKPHESALLKIAEEEDSHYRKIEFLLKGVGII